MFGNRAGKFSDALRRAVLVRVDGLIGLRGRVAEIGRDVDDAAAAFLRASRDFSSVSINAADTPCGAAENTAERGSVATSRSISSCDLNAVCG